MRSPTAALLLLVGLVWSWPASAEGNPFSGFEVRTLTRETKHLETAALICALRLENADDAAIAEAWKMHFAQGPTRDDQLLVNTTMSQLCPPAKTR